MEKAGVPKPFRRALAKPAIALEEIDRLIAQGLRFGAPFSPMQATVCPLRPARAKQARGFCDAEPDGAASEGLSAQLALVVGAPKHQKVYPAGVSLIFPVAGRGRPRKNSWRRGVKAI